MAERSSANRDVRDRALLWFLVATLGVIVWVVAFSSPEWLEEQIRKEQSLLAQWYSEQMAAELVLETNEMFDAWMVQTGAVEGLRRFMIPTDEARLASQGLETLGQDTFETVDRMLQAWWLLVYQTLMRLQIFIGWSIYLLPLIAAAAYDGLIRRRVKQHSYGYASPVRYRVALGLIGWVVFIFIFYLGFPYTPDFAPLVPIACYLAMGASISWATGNLQKRV